MQVPQLMVPPHPFDAVPQFCPAGQVVTGTHAAHVSSVAPTAVFWHVCGDVHCALLVHCTQSFFLRLV